MERVFSTSRVFILKSVMRIKGMSKELINEILIQCSKKSLVDVAQSYSTTPVTIRKIVKKSGIKFKKSRLNMSHLALEVNYFKEIDSYEKAYWLGMICADGNIKKSNNKVTLVSKDLELIEGFKKSIESEHTIGEIKKLDKRTNKIYYGYSIQIGNELFTAHLINLGVTSNKTNVLNFPEIDEKYYPYFIAGLFDGDGSVSLCGKNKNKLRVNLISTKEVLNHIDKYILTKLTIKPTKYRCHVSKNKTNVWKMYLYADAHRFLEYIYGDDEFKCYLKRKYDIYLNNIETRKNVRHFRKINQYDSNMCLIKTWSTQQDVANALMSSPTTFNNYLTKFKDKMFKNYYWRYENS